MNPYKDKKHELSATTLLIIVAVVMIAFGWIGFHYLPTPTRP